MSIENITFRKITPDDLSIINQLMRQGKKYWGYSEEGLDRFMKNSEITDESYFTNGFGFIAETPQDIIGYYLFKIHAHPATLELDHLFLNTKFICKGYGRLLWTHCIEQAKKMGWAKLTFESDPHSLGFYEHMGAIKIDERPMVTLPGHMAPVMKFSIPSHFSN